MATKCACGDELTVQHSDNKQISYCQNCGFDETLTIKRQAFAPVISLNRAAILKKMNNPPVQETKKPKQIRDRTDYTKARRAR